MYNYSSHSYLLEEVSNVSRRLARLCNSFPNFDSRVADSLAADGEDEVTTVEEKRDCDAEEVE